MRKILNSLFLATALLGAYTAKAQTGSGMHTFAGAAEVQVTYRNTNLDQLNQALNKSGIPPLKGSDIWINLAMSHIHNKVIFEDGIGASPMSTSSTNNLKAKYGQAQAFLRVGYDIANNSAIRFFPFAGVNLSGAMLNIQDKARIANTADFSTEITNSTSSKTFYQGNFGIELGAGIDYSIKLKDKQTDCFTVQRSIPIGVRAGYYINASQSDWKVDDYKLQNGPDQKQSAIFVSLNIGLGYKVTKLK